MWLVLQAVRQNLLGKPVTTLQKLIHVDINQYAAVDLNTKPEVSMDPHKSNEIDVHIDLTKIVNEVMHSREKQGAGLNVNVTHSKARGTKAPIMVTATPTLQQVQAPYQPRKGLFLKVTAVGRLGNQLFLWASGMGIARKNRATLCFENLELGKTFKGPFPGRCPGVRFANIIAEEGFGLHQDISFSSSSAIRPYSYLQSFKYFQGMHLKDKLQFLPAIEKRATEYITSKQLHGKTLVGIHIRRGDLIEANWNYVRFPPDQYFINAMRYFREKIPGVHFVVASSNVTWPSSKPMFRASDITIVTEKHSAAVDLALLSLCSHTILSVGTFGWWSAYLSGGHAIYYEKEYMLEHRIVHNKFKAEDFYPPHWIKMNAHPTPTLPPPTLPGSQIILKKNDPVMIPGSWDGSPIVLEQFKLLFFTIPKNSCEEFKRLFRRMKGLSDWRTHYNHPPVGGKPGTTIPHDPQVNGLKYLYHYSPEQATRIVNDPSWTKAIFIRDPLTRFLSAYLDKIVNHPYRMKKLHLNFEQFVGKVENGFKDPHWNPQCALIDCKKWLPRLNFIGRVSTIAQDTKNLLKRVKAWERFGSTGWEGGGAIFQGKRYSDHVTGAKAKLAKYFTPSLEKRVRALLVPDYEQLPLSP